MFVRVRTAVTLILPVPRRETAEESGSV
jgi:hypothetical protein